MTQVREGLRPARPEWLSVNLVVSTVVVVAGMRSGPAGGSLTSVVPVPAPTLVRTRLPVWLIAVFFVLAALAEVIYVPVRHGDSWEELAFVEVVVIWGVLVLPPFTAIVTCLIGFAFTAAIMRRPLVKSLFNLGSYAIAGVGLMVTYWCWMAGPTSSAALGRGARGRRTRVRGAQPVLLSVILLAAGEVPPREFLGRSRQA